MFRKFLKTAAAAAAITAMPVSAIAASPASSLSVADNMRADASLENENNQFEGLTQYAIPVVIVIVIGLALYFALDDDGDGVSV